MGSLTSGNWLLWPAALGSLGSLPSRPLQAPTLLSFPEVSCGGVADFRKATKCKSKKPVLLYTKVQRSRRESIAAACRVASVRQKGARHGTLPRLGWGGEEEVRPAVRASAPKVVRCHDVSGSALTICVLQDHKGLFHPYQGEC